MTARAQRFGGGAARTQFDAARQRLTALPRDGEDRFRHILRGKLPVLPALGRAAGEASGHAARHDRGDPDAPVAEVEHHRLGEPDEPELRGVVGGASPERMAAGEAADVHHRGPRRRIRVAAFAGLEEQREACLRDAEHAGQVRFDHPAELVHAQLQGRPVDADAGVVHQDVEPPAPLPDQPRQRLDALPVPNITGRPDRFRPRS